MSAREFGNRYHPASMLSTGLFPALGELNRTSRNMGENRPEFIPGFHLFPCRLKYSISATRIIKIYLQVNLDDKLAASFLCYQKVC